jgi:hypothetical protein
MEERLRSQETSFGLEAPWSGKRATRVPETPPDERGKPGRGHQERKDLHDALGRDVQRLWPDSPRAGEDRRDEPAASGTRLPRTPAPNCAAPPPLPGR